MGAEELASALARLGGNAAALGRAVVPPVKRSHVSEMARGKRTIGNVMAARLREAIRRLEQE